MYRKEYCEMLKKHMGTDGLSYEAFAGVVGVSIQTLYVWESKHQDFVEAKSDAMALGRLFWERIGSAGMAGQIPGFNATVWIFNMKNRHQWRDRIETENKHEISGSINLNGAIVQMIEEFEAGGGKDPEDC